MAKHSLFSKSSTAEEVTKGLNLSGLTYVITGVNSGLGYETMRVLSDRGAHVIGIARSLEKAKRACNSVQGKTTPVAGDLSDMGSVKKAAEAVINLKTPIDALICNAGIMAPPNPTVKDGLEIQFLTNHMGHFLLSYLLQERLKEANGGRLIMLSSMAHLYTVKNGIDFDNLDGSKGYNAWQFYGQSKLANLLTAVAFNERLAEFGVTANAVHPGVIKTNLDRQLDGVLGLLMSLPFFGKVMELTGGKSIPQGASTQCFVATHPSLKGMGGKYFADNRIVKASRHGRNEALAEKLFDYSLNYLAPYIGKSPKRTRTRKKKVQVIGEDS